MPDPAPPVDGRRARRHRSRDLAVDALLDLLGEGVLRPTAQQVAERSGVSLRSIFRIFDDVESLNAAACARQLSRVRHLFVDVPADGHARRRGSTRSSPSTAASTSRSRRSDGPPSGRHRSRRPLQEQLARARGLGPRRGRAGLRRRARPRRPRTSSRPWSWRCRSRRGTSCGRRRACRPLARRPPSPAAARAARAAA